MQYGPTQNLRHCGRVVKAIDLKSIPVRVAGSNPVNVDCVKTISHSVVVITLGFDSSNVGSIPIERFFFVKKSNFDNCSMFSELGFSFQKILEKLNSFLVFRCL